MKNTKPHVVVLDIETQKSADEVGGWNHIDRMKVAVAVIWDSKTRKTDIFYENDIDRLVQHLRTADMVVGFNLLRFDYTVLSGYQDHKNIAAELENKTVDILNQVEQKLGHRLSLAAIVSQTLGKDKSADGQQSLQWFKEGKLEKIAQYCKDDVLITRDLFKHILIRKEIHYTSKFRPYPLTARIELKLPPPWKPLQT